MPPGDTLNRTKFAVVQRWIGGRFTGQTNLVVAITMERLLLPQVPLWRASPPITQGHTQCDVIMSLNNYGISRRYLLGCALERE